jgi:hypothetical protein
MLEIIVKTNYDPENEDGSKVETFSIAKEPGGDETPEEMAEIFYKIMLVMGYSEGQIRKILNL